MAREPYILVEPYSGDGMLHVPGNEARHLKQALRTKAGYRIIGFDGQGHGWEAEIVEIGQDVITCRVIRSLSEEPAPPVRFHICVGIVKGARMDLAVEKAAEIGASSFTPLITERGVIDPGRGKLERWRNIALAAAKQSRRLTLMRIGSPVDISEMNSDRSSPSGCLVMDNSENAKPMIEHVATLKDVAEITIFIGPEGGFSPDEIDLFTRGGLPLVSLGGHPLRTETAVAVALGMLVNLVLTK